MSLKTLCRVHTATIERQSVTGTSAMGAQKTYSQANRAGKPISTRCRVVELSGDERQDYALRGIEATDAIFVEEKDPEVDERDRFVHDSDYLYVKHVKNPDRLGRFWKVACIRVFGNLPK